MHREFRPNQAQTGHGFTLLEIMVASFIAFLALTGILYLYKSVNRNMLIQSGISQMRMNAQYTSEEIQYYLAHNGLGLPRSIPYLLESKGDLVVRLNRTKRSAACNKDPSSTSSLTRFWIAIQDTGIFSEAAFAITKPDNGAGEAPVLMVRPRPGHPLEAELSLSADATQFPDVGNLYPVEKIRLHRCTGVGADTVGGDFRIIWDNPGLRKNLVLDTLTLAEGIESLTYRYFLRDNSQLAALPASLATLAQIEISVVAKSLVQDKAGKGDGYARDTLLAKTNYKRSF
jgi:hypothetical protein